MKKTYPSLRLIALLWIAATVNIAVNFVAVAQIPDGNGIVYVKPAATGSGNGSSWTHATADLQGAVNAAGVQKVYVATGNYNVPSGGLEMKNNVEIYGGFDPAGGITDLSHGRILPTLTTGGSVLNGQNTSTVILNDKPNYSARITGSAVLDGFTITGGSSTANAGGGGMYNSYSSPTCRNLVIKGNTTQKSGGGVFNSQASSPSFTNVIIANNTAPNSSPSLGNGAGMLNAASSSPVLVNVEIINNVAAAGGGGISNGTDCNPVLTNVKITGNSAGTTGGAIEYWHYGTTTLRNVTIADNTPNALFSAHESSYTIYNSIVYGGIRGQILTNGHYDPHYSLIEGNTNVTHYNISAAGVTLTDIFTNHTGGNYTLKQSSPAVNSGNNALYTGLGADTRDLAGNPRVYYYSLGGTIDLGAYESSYNPAIIPDGNGIVYVKPAFSGMGNGNSWNDATADLHNAIHAENAGKVFVAAGNYPAGDHSFIMKNGVAIYGGFDPLNDITDLTHNRISPSSGTGLSGSVLDGSNARPVIWNDFAAGTPLNSTAVLDGFTLTNAAGSSGNGCIYNKNASPTLNNLLITGNAVTGIYNMMSSPVVTNTAITHNTAGGARGLYQTGGNSVLNNVTIAGNEGHEVVIIAYDMSNPGSIELNNSVIYGTVAGYTNGNITAQHCLIEGNPVPGVGNADATGFPATSVFVDISEGNYALRNTSPAVNAGNNGLFPGLSSQSKDLAGNARLAGAAIDMGAYEFTKAIVTDENGIVYVKQAATGNGTGLNWENATADLQGAIDAGGTTKVFVATGNYDVGGSSFVMKNNVAIYGGFNPVNNTTDWDSRILPNKGMGDGSVLNGKNERPVIYNVDNGLNNTAVLDGFTLTNGKSLTSGGGIFNRNTAPVFNNLVIKNNEAETSGGGIYNVNAPVMLSNTVIKDNTALYGGGMRNNGSASVLTNVNVTGNSATMATAGAGGGGIFNENSALLLTNVAITSNSTGFQGGGFRNLSGNPVFTNVTFANNTAVNNTATAAMDISGGAPQLNNSVVFGTIAGGYTARHSLVEDNTDFSNGNVNAAGITPAGVFTNPSAGNYTLKNGSPAVNKGSNALYTGWNPDTRDLAGNARIYNHANSGVIDIGAYESSYTPFVPDGNGTVFVKDAAAGKEDGSDWDNATADLHNAIHAADVQKVFVAVGEYKVGDNSFVMANNVAIYGGFDPGAGVTDLTHNRILPNRGMGDGSVLNGQNIRPVIWNAFEAANPINNTAVLDGFTIMNGRGGFFGGGIYNTNASPVYRNLVVRNNTASSGGGIYVSSSAPVITNVIISDNYSYTASVGGGGGMYNESGYPVLTNVLITGNEANHYAGGIFNYSGIPVFNNVTIAGNELQGLVNWSGGNISTIHNSIIYGGILGNYTAQHSLIQNNAGGTDGNLDGTAITSAQVFNDASTGNYTLKAGSPAINAGNNDLYPLLDANTRDMAGNLRLSGSAIDLGAYEFAGTPDGGRIIYVREGANGDGSDWDNATGDLQGAINAAGAGKVFVATGSYEAPAGGFVMKKGVAVYGGFDPGAGITDLSHDRVMPDATFYFLASVLDGSNERPVIYNHFASDDPLDDTAILDGFAIVGGSGSYGGGIHNYFASPALKNLLLMRNTSYHGAGMYNYASSPALINVDITDNTSDHCAGIYNDAHDAQSLTLTNVAITGNNVGSESPIGGILLETGALTATNVTIASNSGASALYLGSAATAVVHNSIIYGGIPGDGTCASRNSIIEGSSSTANGNLDASGITLKDLFVNEFSAMLSACSPAINAGDNSLLPAGTTTDIAGAARIQLGVVDMGAYEAESDTPDESAAMAAQYQSITLPLDLDDPTVFTNDCSTLIATIMSIGEVPITGETTARVWIEEDQPERYVRRHYEIFPENGDPDLLTGEVTIYFTQEEFDDYNKENGIKLPTGPDDEEGIENIIIEKRGGKSTDGTGLPHTYPGETTNIYPLSWNIWWNRARERWEVTFFTEGFSGFFVKTDERVLPVRWISFEGRLSDQRQATLTWKTEETNVSHYEVERSVNAKEFRIVNTVTAGSSGSGSYSLTDPAPVSGTVYYRIRQVDLDGTFSYSRIISLSSEGSRRLFAYPNPAQNRITVELSPEYKGTMVNLISTSGIVLQQTEVKEDTLILDVSNYVSGVYLLKLYDGKVVKLIKE